VEIKAYKIFAYAYLVKAGEMDLEPAKGSEREIVPEEYRLAVAEYLIEK